MTKAMLSVCLLSAGCAQVRLQERYPIDGTAEQIGQAARETASRLGWTTADAQNGRFRITDYPRYRGGSGPLTVEPRDGVLLVEGDAVRLTGRGEPDGDRLLESASILASATRSRLHAEAGPGVTSRSALLAVAIDLALPAAGAVYALRGDPYYDSNAVLFQRSWWQDFWARIAMDQVAVMYLLGGYIARQQGVPWLTSPWDLVVPLCMLAIDRVSSAVVDALEVHHRNVYAASGLPAPAEVEPVVSFAGAPGPP